MWDWLLRCDKRLLILGFDDTLTRFLTPRREPRLARAIDRAIRAVAGCPTDIVVVHSASRLDELARALRSVPAHLIAECGWEERPLHGRRTVHQLPTRTQRRLARAAAAAEACGWRALLARRRCSILLRTRGLPAEESSRMSALGQELWSLFETDGLKVQVTSSGVELRAMERTTALAVELLARQCGDEPRIVRVDTANRAVDRGEPSDSVSRPGGFRDGAVSVHLEEPDDLLRFLDKWVTRREAVVGPLRHERRPLTGATELRGASRG